MPTPHLVVVGASAGGVRALLQLLAALPHEFAAPICAVVHIGAHRSLLPGLITERIGRAAMHAVDGQDPRAGVVYVAPPDHHLVVVGPKLHLHRGPKENLARPAIDPLFRSAALSWRERAVGVILSGRLDDGAAGLRLIKDCGGVALVQDPRAAEEPGMPTAALQAAEVDACLPVPALAGRLFELLRQAPPPASPAFPTRGAPQQQEAAEALRSAVRALHERELLLARMATLSARQGDAAAAAAGRAEAARLHEHVLTLTRMAQQEALTDGPGRA